MLTCSHKFWPYLYFIRIFIPDVFNWSWSFSRIKKWCLFEYREILRNLVVFVFALCFLFVSFEVFFGGVFFSYFFIITNIWIYFCPFKSQRILHSSMIIGGLIDFLLIYIYIYIYIYILSSTDRLFRSISVARHAWRSTSGSKPVQLYVRLSFRPVGHQTDYVG